jgi:hypothetical protein
VSYRSDIKDESLAEILCKYIGETVTIYTTSGGVSGCGFTGVILSVTPCLVRLITRIGVAPSSPFGHGGNQRFARCGPGSVCDIPLDRIVSFVHNAV